MTSCNMNEVIRGYWELLEVIIRKTEMKCYCRGFIIEDQFIVTIITPILKEIKDNVVIRMDNNL